MKRIILRIYVAFLFVFAFFSCTSNKIEAPISTSFTQTTNDTSSLSNVGYYHNIIVDSLNRFFSTLPSNQIDSLIKNNEWVYSNTYIKAANILRNLPEFQNLEFDTSGSYSFVISFRDIILDTNGFFDEDMLEFLHNIYPNDTLIHIVNQIIWCLTQPNRAELIDSLINLVNSSDYSEMLKKVTLIGCSIGLFSFDFWNSIVYFQLDFRKLNSNNRDKILVAPAAVAIAGSDIIGGDAAAITSSNSGWGYVKDIAVGAGAASAITGLGYGAGRIASFLSMLKFW